MQSFGYKRVSFFELCRLCAQNIEGNKIYIFNNNDQHDVLKNKIKNCLSIEVNKKDFLPKVICLNCNSELERCHAYREECLKSEEMLSSYFKNSRFTEGFKKCGEVYIRDTTDAPSNPAQQTIVGTIILAKPPKPNQRKTSDEANLVLETTNESQSNKSKTNIDRDIPEVCQLDSISMLNAPTKNLPLDNLDSGIVNMNNNNNNNNNTNISEASNNIELLPNQPSFGIEVLKKAAQQLPKNFLNILNSNGQLINVTLPNMLTIEQSNVLISRINGLSNKQLNNKNSEESTTVDQEKQPEINQNPITIDIIDIDNNDATKILNDSHSSTVNPVVFPVSQYQNNVEKQSPTITFQSSVNISSITTSTTISTATSEFSNIRPNPPANNKTENVKSNISPNTSSTSSKRAKRPKRPHPQRIHTCDKCSKSFKRREVLHQHLNSHTTSRPYKCTICHKSFVRKEHLSRHLVLHSGERKFVCTICKKDFARHDNLLKHSRIHNKDKSYPCDVCEQKFYMKQKLDAHLRKGKCCVIIEDD